MKYPTETKTEILYNNIIIINNTSDKLLPGPNRQAPNVGALALRFRKITSL